ncbi:cytochrome P450 94A2-like [Impatiens glandulifera]|uniref:cytochrome P450 94A2-like n=1 Tax=Impatiens glandulifera TaxID=253017 RepID=UPI001FB17AA3|nr:cytochrome P450 94A2-like [Impatiens glandulifera]
MMMMLNLELCSSLFLYFLPALFLIVLVQFKSSFKALLFSSSSSDKKNPTIPRSYPFIGSIFSIYANKERGVQWTSELVLASPSHTFILHRPICRQIVFTANPANVRHILKTHFHNYEKGDFFRIGVADFLGDGIFNTDDDKWKFQRQVASHEFNTKSLRKFIEQVVDSELSDRLIPILSAAAANNTVLDFQDILQRFTFDNVCKIAFGYDPAYLSPSLPNEKFAQAFEDAARITSRRFQSFHPLIWKIKRYLNVGSEKDLRIAVNQVRDFAKHMIKEKNKELKENASSLLNSVDLLSRFLSSGHSDENFVTDIVISFILAGRDTTSAALEWFFWLVSKHQHVENQILREITHKSESNMYEEVKEMVYTHAALNESMRLYPPVPIDSKQAVDDDILPDGTVVKRGTRVGYHTFAMGRSEEIWGNDWSEFRPERWLKEDRVTGGRQFVAKDVYEYPVFQAGPRICLGKEMAVLQMKSIASGVLRRFKVIPVTENNQDPVLITYFTSKMKGGFLVRIEKRKEEGCSVIKDI